MTRLAAYRGYWTNHPPTHLLAAAWIGYKPPIEQKPGQSARIIDLPDAEE